MERGQAKAVCVLGGRVHFYNDAEAAGGNAYFYTTVQGYMLNNGVATDVAIIIEFDF